MASARAPTSPGAAKHPGAGTEQLGDGAASEGGDRRPARQCFGDDEPERLLPRRGDDGHARVPDDLGKDVGGEGDRDTGDES